MSIAAGDIVVVALGGHAFLSNGQAPTWEAHLNNARRVAAALADLVERGFRLVVTHGNGPQVGALLLQSEAAAGETPALPLDALVAQTQGSLGYLLQQALGDALRARGIDLPIVTVVTQVMVASHDPALQRPSKPVGPVYDEVEALTRIGQGWVMVEEPGRGHRRVVPSPTPVRVLQGPAIREIAAAGNLVIAGGGGGIPVIEDTRGAHVGVEAVVDKDRTAALIAQEIGAALFLVLTDIDAVYLDYGTPNARALGAVTLSEARRHLAAGHFAEGSMGPKVGAVIDFLESGGRRALITNVANLPDALDGAAGTHWVGKIG